MINLVKNIFFLMIKVNSKSYYVTIEPQKQPKMDRNSIMNPFFCPKGKKSLGQRPKPAAGARSWPCVAGHTF